MSPEAVLGMVEEAMAPLKSNRREIGSLKHRMQNGCTTNSSG